MYFIVLEKQIYTKRRKGANQEHVTPLKTEATGSNGTARKRASEHIRNKLAGSALESIFVETRSIAQHKYESSPNNIATTCADTDKKNGRSRREIKRTSKFKEYLEDQNAQTKNVQKTVESKQTRNRTKVQVRSVDNEQGSLIISFSAPSQKKDVEGKESNTDSNYKEVSVDSITEPEQDRVRSDNLDENQDHLNAVSEIKGTEKQYEASINARKERKRKSSSTEENIPVKSKKIPDVPVTLQEYPESYCMEEYMSPAPEDKGKPAVEKICQRYLCKLCSAYRTVSQEQMEKHITLHVNKRLDCRKCGTVFNSLYNLSHHERQEHHDKALFMCEHCGDNFSEKRLYKKHLSKVHKEAAYKCPSCQKQFLTNKEYRQHRLDEHENSAFKCNKCGSIFVSEKMLERHEKNKVCEIKSFECQECGCVKKTQAILDEHVRKIHSKEHCYKCNLCTYSTRQHYMLKQHMRAHLGIHPHKCDQCNFSCVKKWQLVSHKRTHSGEKGYKCQRCNYAAAWNVQLKTHMKAHESDTQEICKVCNIVFKDTKSFRTHILKEHGTSVKKASGINVYRPKSKLQNMVPIAGTNMVIYGKERSLNAREIKSVDSGAPLLFSARDENYSGSDKNKTITTNKIMGPLSRNYISLIGGDKVTMQQKYLVGFNVSAEELSQKQNLNILNDSCKAGDICKTSPKAANLNDINTSLANTRVISLLVNSTETPTINSLSETIDGEISNYIVSNVMQKVTNTPKAGTHSTNVQEYDEDIRNSLTVSGESGTVKASASRTAATGSTYQYNAQDGRGNGLKRSSDTLLNLNDSKAANNLPRVQNKNVTLIRMQINPDGTRIFKTVDSNRINTAQVLPSTSTTSATVTYQSKPVTPDCAQEVHNYAVPFHKRNTRQENCLIMNESTDKLYVPSLFNEYETVANIPNALQINGSEVQDDQMIFDLKGNNATENMNTEMVENDTKNLKN